MSSSVDSQVAAAAPAATHGELPVLRITPPHGWLELDFRELWQARELLYFFIWRDIKVRYKQTVIGAAWAVLQPVMTMIVFTIFFGKLAQMNSNGLPYPVFSYAGLLPWTYFSTALASATATVVEQQRVITKVYFPRLVLPLSAVLSGLVDFAIAFVGLHSVADLLSHLSESLDYFSAGVFAARNSHRACGGPVAFRAQCDLPRRSLRDAFPSSILDVRVSGDLSLFASSREVARALRIESDGWGN